MWIKITVSNCLVPPGLPVLENAVKNVEKSESLSTVSRMANAVTDTQHGMEMPQKIKNTIVISSNPTGKDISKRARRITLMFIAEGEISYQGSTWYTLDGILICL